MINLKIRGRLGNQMFQYAAALAIKKRLSNSDCKINTDFSTVYKYGFDNELKYFKTESLHEGKIKFTLEQLLLVFKYKILKKINKSKAEEQRIKNIEKGIIYHEGGYQNYKISSEKNIFMSGFFESPNFFIEAKKEIQKEYVPVKEPLEKNRNLYSVIESSESVCVTIRRGDFLSEKYKSKFYVCTPEYFKAGVKEIKKIVKNPRFIVFSDDIQWCKKNLDFFPHDTLYEDGDDPVWEKLRLMYSCKHFIISNSTFSWWAQFLSRNDDKIVVAPSKWYNIGDNKDIYEENWHLIDIDGLK